MTKEQTPPVNETKNGPWIQRHLYEWCDTCGGNEHRKSIRLCGDGLSEVVACENGHEQTRRALFECLPSEADEFYH